VQTRPLIIEEISAPQNGSHVLRHSGPLVLSTLGEFQSRVRADRSNNLILDLTDVPYVDSAGIGALVGTYVRHQRDENGLSLVGVNDRVHAALKIAHIEQFFRFFPSLPEAQAKRTSTWQRSKPD
jgi:anti-sigma B factor antagonist